MELRIGIVIACAALAALAAGNAQAAASDATTPDASTITMVCADGTEWTFDTDYFDAATYGDIFCGGEFSVIEAATAATIETGDSVDSTPDPVDVGLGADPNMAPDPAQYGTEVRCPDGSIWAVPIGDYFVCPAA